MDKPQSLTSSLTALDERLEASARWCLEGDSLSDQDLLDIFCLQFRMMTQLTELLTSEQKTCRCGSGCGD